jgi:hypothetical protein
MGMQRMTGRLGFAIPGAAALVLLALSGCATGESATPSRSASQSTPSSSSSEAPVGEEGESESSGDSAPLPDSPDEVDSRFLITCFYPDGTEVATFTRLEEAWASTNYVRIDHCEASVGASEGFELTEDEAAVADVAVAGLPDEDPTELYLQTLAACVRIPPQGDQGVGTYPDSILEAALELCPEAPHAGIIQQELAARSGG